MASRGQKKVPKSAAYLKSVPPSEKRKKRQSSSAVTQRVATQPPVSCLLPTCVLSSEVVLVIQVCGVQPGKALELKTSLGILKAKELLAQQQAEQQRIEEAGDDLSLLQTASTTRGQLKHGR